MDQQEADRYWARFLAERLDEARHLDFELRVIEDLVETLATAGRKFYEWRSCEGFAGFDGLSLKSLGIDQFRRDLAAAEDVRKTMIRSGLGATRRYAILERDSFSCQLCGATAKESRLEIDHKIPVSRGGTNDPENLWTLCMPCNRGKGAELLDRK